MAGLRAAAASAIIPADDSMVIAGSILPGYAQGEEAELRATCLLIEAEVPVCLISCDVLGLSRDLLDRAAVQVAEACKVPFDNVLITCTHTHHAPSTFTVHGYDRDEGFCEGAIEAIVAAATEAREKLTAAAALPNESEAELLYALGQEHTVGKNSRWLMRDGQITWYGFDAAERVRPTGAHDPDLPVLALRRPGREHGGLVGALFCHATHNIGTLTTDRAVRSPAVFGLTARELERRHGAPFLFCPGAFGSSHRMGESGAAEDITRLTAATEDALARLQPALDGPVLCLKRPFTCTLRTFDEEAEAERVHRWNARWYDADTTAAYDEAFAAMRRELAPRQGQTFDTWLQVIRLGSVAIVGVPGEMFGALGLDIRRRSPFRNTIVIGLANDEVGYIPNRPAYDDGGYQLWVGGHSVLAPGTGEAMVEAALEMLQEAFAGDAAHAEPALDILRPTDAAGLQRFYNTLGAQPRWFFRPLGWCATCPDAAAACADAAAGKRHDVVLRAGDRIVGWAFVLGMDKDTVDLGIGVADDWCGKGLGRRLMEAVIEESRARGKQAVSLIHVKGNVGAGTLYRKLGFVETGEHTGSDGNEYWEMRLDLC
jgi:ribosomal protein S18 acetylase RimI-like enzyme